MNREVTDFFLKELARLLLGRWLDVFANFQIIEFIFIMRSHRRKLGLVELYKVHLSNTRMHLIARIIGVILHSIGLHIWILTLPARVHGNPLLHYQKLRLFLSCVPLRRIILLNCLHFITLMSPVAVIVALSQLILHYADNFIALLIWWK